MGFTLSRRLFLAASLAAAAFLVGSCGDSGNNGGTGSTTKPAKGPNDKLTLAFVTNNSSDFWTIARAGTEKAKQELTNVDVDFEIPGDGQAPTQKRIVDDLLAKGVDGIAISPIDPANQTKFLNDVASKAMLVTQDSDAPASDRACYIGTNNVDAGRQAGELIKQALPDGGKIMMFVGNLDAQNAKDRREGILEAIKGSKIEVIDTKTDDTDHVRAKANVADTLVKYPDVAALVGLWSYNGPAILSAVKDAGKNGKVKIVCFDEEDDTLAGVKSGDIYATVVQQPYEFGHMSMLIMAKALRGDKSMIPASKQIFIPTLAIDQSKVDDFAANLKKLRGR